MSALRAGADDPPTDHQSSAAEPAVIMAVAAEPSRPRWWREGLYVLAFYAVYTGIRDLHGRKPVSVAQAFHNGRRVISAERFFGLFQEQHIQHVFVHHRAFIAFWDVFYGTAHFVITIGVMLFLFQRMPDRYRVWRNTLGFTTALALIGFAFFPLMPPRLLPANYHFVDTLKTIGGLWSFDSGAMSKVSNQFAAMPSLHFAWSSWCVFALWPALKRPLAKAALLVYPVLTLFCIVVTANHYVLDAVGGAAALLIGFPLGVLLTRQVDRFSRARLGRL
jgi:hypothetical protein